MQIPQVDEKVTIPGVKKAPVKDWCFLFCAGFEIAEGHLAPTGG